MTAYLVVAYHCDPCDIQMPVVGSAPGGPIKFVTGEMRRHNSRVHGQDTLCGGKDPHDPHWYGNDICGGI